MPPRLFATLALASFLIGHPADIRAESFLSMPEPDLLATMKAPEALSRTRKAQVIYPAPGLPSLIRAGQEIVVRVRVRRAMTPPPGVPQRNVLLGWGSTLVYEGAPAAPGIQGVAEYPLQVHQIRPEDEGFVYRVRLKTPAFLPAGVYGLRFNGPGFSDTRPRSVRVLERSVRSFELAVVSSGRSLWEEAEALALLDTAAVLVPGHLSEAALPLSRWPLATFSVPGPEEVTACRALELEREVAMAVAEAADCQGEVEADREVATCVNDAIGSSGVFRGCGDGLVDYVRRFGPPAYAVGIGDVALVGLNTADRPLEERAARRVRLGKGPLVSFPLTGQIKGALGAVQRSWSERVFGYAKSLLIVGHHPPKEWLDSGGQRVLDALREKSGLYVAAGPGPTSPSLLRGAAMIELSAVESSTNRAELGQLRGLDPGRFVLGPSRHREPFTPSGTCFTPTPRGLEISIEHPPPHRLRLRILVPASRRGWTIEGQTRGREVMIADVAPGHGNLCDLEQVLLVIEVPPGTAQPLKFSVEPADGAPLEVAFERSTESLTVGRNAELRVVAADGDEDLDVFWDLGDQKSARGRVVQHRYLESGPAQICAQAIDRRGRAAVLRVELQVARWRESFFSRPFVTRTVGGGLIAFACLGFLFALRKGNILGGRQRLS